MADRKENPPPTIFDRLKADEPIPMDDPDYSKIREVVNRTIEISSRLNASTSTEEVREHLEAIIGSPIPESTTIFPPFHTNFGRFIQLGRGIFINHACSFLDLGGITIEDNAMIGPRVNITSEDHPADPDARKTLLPGEVVIRQNA